MLHILIFSARTRKGVISTKAVQATSPPLPVRIKKSRHLPRTKTSLIHHQVAKTRKGVRIKSVTRTRVKNGVKIRTGKKTERTRTGRVVMGIATKTRREVKVIL